MKKYDVLETEETSKKQRGKKAKRKHAQEAIHRAMQVRYPCMGKGW